MTYEEAMKFITDTAKFGSRLGLERMNCILKHLGNPEKDLKCIHIAGTNGKGSVAAIMAEAIENAGYTAGLYTSPFIEEFEERIQINRKNISKEDIAVYTEKIKDAVLKCIEEGCEHPTEFEIITALMFLYFKEKSPDYCVIEVGLGGDLDSTNVLTPSVSVITSLSMDHMDVLGDTIEKIAKAKAGIIKHAPVVSYPQAEGAKRVIEETAEKMNVPLTFIKEEDVSFKRFDKKTNTQVIDIRIGDKTEEAKLSLLGKHQLLNSLLAVTALKEFASSENIEISDEVILKTLSTVKWMGRLEMMNHDPLVLIDGAHNEEGIEKLKESLDMYYKGRNYILILGILADKNVEKMTQIIAPDAKKVICITPNSHRASQAEDLYHRIKNLNDNCVWFENYEDALKDALKSAEGDDYIIASGSLYMVGSMRPVMRKYFNDHR